MEHIALTMFLGFFSKISEIEKIEKNIKKKKVYTSDGINASDENEKETNIKHSFKLNANIKKKNTA
jgi:hypothetical protein